MPSKDTTAVEIITAKSKLEELRALIDEEKKNNERLRGDAEKKIEVIKRLEMDQSEEVETFHLNKDTAEGKRKSTKLETEKVVSEIRKQQQELLIELSRFEISQQEHEKLESKLRNLAITYHKEYTEKTSEIEAKKRQTFDTKMSLDRLFRKTLLQFEKEYQQRAHESIDEEVRNARDELVKLTKSIDQRDKMCVDILNEQQKSYEKLVKLKVNLDVLLSTTYMEEQMSEKISISIQQSAEQIREKIRNTKHLYSETINVSNHLQYRKFLMKELETCATDKTSIIENTRLLFLDLEKISLKMREEVLVVSQELMNKRKQAIDNKFQKILQCNQKIQFSYNPKKPTKKSVWTTQGISLTPMPTARNAISNLTRDDALVTSRSVRPMLESISASTKSTPKSKSTMPKTLTREDIMKNMNFDSDEVWKIQSHHKVNGNQELRDKDIILPNSRSFSMMI